MTNTDNQILKFDLDTDADSNTIANVVDAASGMYVLLFLDDEDGKLVVRNSSGVSKDIRSAATKTATRTENAGYKLVSIYVMYTEDACESVRNRLLNHVAQEYPEINRISVSSAAKMSVYYLTRYDDRTAVVERKFSDIREAQKDINSMFGGSLHVPSLAADLFENRSNSAYVWGDITVLASCYGRNVTKQSLKSFAATALAKAAMGVPTKDIDKSVQVPTQVQSRASDWADADRRFLGMSVKQRLGLSLDYVDKLSPEILDELPMDEYRALPVSIIEALT